MKHTTESKQTKRRKQTTSSLSLQAPKALPGSPQQAYISFDELSEKAKMHAMMALDRHVLPASITRSINLLTHEKIAPVEIEKFAKQYAATVQAERDARDRTHCLAQRLLAEGDEISDFLHAALQEAFKAKRDQLVNDIDPLVLEAAERRRSELVLRRKQVQLAERRVRVSESKLRLDRKKARATIQRLEQKARRGGSLTGKEVQRIREIYGICDEKK